MSHGGRFRKREQDWPQKTFGTPAPQSRRFRKGLGSKLLQTAEAEAIRRGCKHAHLDTLDFQAPGFYLKKGYQVFGELQDLPPGHRRIFLRKDLA
jgi:ribosomal protein S18 acetylase RimI-like enzyme